MRIHDAHNVLQLSSIARNNQVRFEQLPATYTLQSTLELDRSSRSTEDKHFDDPYDHLAYQRYLRRSLVLVKRI